MPRIDRRAGPRRRPGRRLLIVCEGDRAEFIYLKKARSALRLSKENVQIASAGGGSPMSVVEHAIYLSRKGGRARSEAAIDQTWAVFDVEDGKVSGASEAVHAAVQAKIAVAISNPSFELWLLLHCRPEAAHLTAPEAKRRCDTELGIPGARRRYAEFDDPRLGSGWTVAAGHAKSGRARVARDLGLDAPCSHDAVLAGNPASNLDDLIVAMRDSRPG